MTSSTSTASAAVDAEISLDGDKFCFAKFMDQTTIERVQNHKNAICGAAHPLLHRVVPGRQIVIFSVTLDITADIIDTLLPYMTVELDSGTLWVSNETLAAFDVVVNKIGAKHTYTNARIARWAFRAQRGSMPVQLQLDCFAESETETPSATFTPGDIGQIYGFVGTSFELDPDDGGYDSYALDRVAIVSDLNLLRQWNSSATLTDALLTNQETYIACSSPYLTTTDSLYWDNRNSVTPRKIRVSFFTQGGNDILRFVLPHAVLIPKSPDIVSKASEIRLPLTWQAHIDASTTPDTEAFQIDHTNAA